MAISMGSREPSLTGLGSVYSFEIDRAADVANIPLMYPDAAATSNAFDTSTYDVYFLRPIDDTPGQKQLHWVKGGVPH